jgi:integrase
MKARNFLNGIFKKTRSEPQVLTQDMLDDYVIWLNTKKNTNAFYRAFIKSFRICFDEDEKLFRLKTKLDRSRKRTALEEYDWLTKESVDILIAKGSPYISMMTAVYFDTGRRLAEIMFCDLTLPDWELDLVTRTIRGLGKGNAEFRGHFSPTTADMIYNWIKNPECINKSKPFMMHKKNGKEYGNPESALDYEFKKQCKRLGVKATNGSIPHVHCLRHATGRYLSQDKSWKIEQVAVKLGHKKLDNTKKYASPDIEQVEAKEDTELYGL